MCALLLWMLSRCSLSMPNYIYDYPSRRRATQLENEAWSNMELAATLRQQGHARDAVMMEATANRQSPATVAKWHSSRATAKGSR